MLIKAISILVGLLACKSNSHGLIKGISFGAVYSCIAFIIFSLLAGTFNLTISLLLDILYCASVGGVMGVIMINIKK